MTFEDTMRQVFREELERAEPKVAERVAALLRDGVGASSNEDRLLRPEEAERVTGYSRETIAGWVRKGKLKRYGTTRGLRVSERELRQYLARTPADRGETPRPITDADILSMAQKRAARGR